MKSSIDYRDFTVWTPDSLAVVRRRLESQVDCDRGWGNFLLASMGRYRGEVSDRGFQIQRFTHKRLPLSLEGSFHPSKQGTKIQVRMKLLPIKLSDLILYGIFYYVVFIIAYVADPTTDPMAIALLLVWPMLTVLFGWSGSLHTAHQTQRDITQLLLGYEPSKKRPPRLPSKTSSPFAPPR